MNPFKSGKYTRSQNLFIVDAILSNASIVLTAGFFLSGYIIHLNGSDFITGLLSNSVTWASIVGLLSILIFEKKKKRKVLLITMNAISRALICSTIFLPLLFKNETFVLYTAVTMVLISNLLYGFYSLGMTVWMVDLLPKDRRNEYIYTRMFILRIFFTLTTVVMGFVLDFFNKSYVGFLVVFITSMILSTADILALIRIEEPIRKKEKTPSLTMAKFFEPFRNKTFLSYLVFIFTFYVTLTMSSSYTSLYLIRYLGFDYSYISTATVLSYVMMIVCTRFWAKIQAKKGQVFVLKVTAFLVTGEYLCNSFLQNGTAALLVVGLILSGIGYSGFNTSIFAYRYEIIPEENRTIYEGWYGAVIGASFLLAPLIGSVLMDLLPDVSNSVYRHSSFQLLYLLSFALCVLTVVITFILPSKFALHDIRQDNP